MLQISYATEPTPGRPNEDFVICGADWAVVLDGATPPAHLDSGCIHGVPWLVRNLAVNVAALAVLPTTETLPRVVCRAIALTCESHKDTCDLENPDSPSATVSLIRLRGDQLDFLTLADSPLIFDIDGEVRVVTDDRTAHLTDYSYAGVSAARNTEGGFYVASTQPEAAYHAVTGSFPLDSVRRVAMLTDGASRLADYFRVSTWAEIMDTLSTRGPAHLIRETRHAESRGFGPDDGRRRKAHDDATALLAVPLQM